MGHYLIFGGNGGIGEAIGRKLSRSGHCVFLTARDEARLRSVGEDIGADYLAGDVLEAGFIEDVVAKAVQGKVLDGLVYAVGSINMKPAARYSQEDIMNDFQLNAACAFQAVQVALPVLKKAEKTASVLLFSTVAFAQGFTAHASISMAKGAVEGLVKALGAELAPKVRVNAIAPSLTDTPLAKKMTSNEAMVKAIGDMHALKRIGTTDDIVGLAEVLLTDAGSYITGQVIGVDGGRSTLRTKG